MPDLTITPSVGDVFKRSKGPNRGGDPHHLQHIWLKRLRDKHTKVNVSMVNTPIPLVGVTLVDFDTFTMTFKLVLADATRIYILFKHGIVGIEVFGEEIAASEI